MNQPLRWITTNGGPLVVVSAEDISRWSGCLPPTQDGTSDYDRVCETALEFTTMDVRGMSVLVFNEEPQPATWFPAITGGTMVRPYSGDNSDIDVPIQSWVRAGSRITREATRSTLVSLAGDYYLFDAAFPGNELGTRLRDGSVVEFARLRFAPGEYEARTGYGDVTRISTVIATVFERR